MLVRSLLERSYCGIDCFVKDKEYLVTLRSYIEYNKKFLELFKNIVIASNYQDITLIEHSNKLWREYFPECKFIDLKINRGHSFGTVDLDNSIFKFCKQNKWGWLCKMSSDFIVKEEFLQRSIEEGDFYFTNNSGYGGIEKWNFDVDSIIKKAFLPQTNFYILNTEKVDFFIDESYINTTYEKSKTIQNFSGRPWEYFPNWSCELFLKNCVENSKLKKINLLSKQEQKNLLNAIIMYRIQDGSHKNILVGGICHFHNPNQGILEI